MQPNLLKADALGSRKSGRLREVSAYGRLKIQCLYVARRMTKCPLTRGVRLREVSVGGGLTVEC